MTECVICFEEIKDNNLDKFKFKCKHKMFHENCLDKCLERKLECPMCRSELKYKDDIKNKFQFNDIHILNIYSVSYNVNNTVSGIGGLYF
jgi:hypothetical protein